MMAKNFTAIVLAGGKGTRMRSPLPKVLQQVGGRSLLYHVFRALSKAGAAKIVVVVGYGHKEVEAEIKLLGLEFEISVDSAYQAEQNGTGHAVQVAFKELKGLNPKQQIMILNGDGPLLTPESLLSFLAAHNASRNNMSLGAMELDLPSGYGRVICRGRFAQKIIEEKEASEKEKKIKLVNGGLYIGDYGFFAKFLPHLKASKRTGEYYLTDLVSLGAKAKQKIGATRLNPEDLRGANDLAELAQVEQIWLRRHMAAFMKAGVRILDPSRVWISANAVIGEGSVLEPGVMLLGKTALGSHVVVEAGARIENTQVANGARVKAYCYLQDSVVGERAQVGPFAHLRPGTKLGAETRIGNFVELKKTELGAHSKVSHLSYVGDAVIGQEVNIGCGFISCNYDGYQKHQTNILDGAFVGSDVQAIAPLTIGKDSYVASGTTLTQSVPDGALAIARVKQENKLGVAEKLRERLRKKAGK